MNYLLIDKSELGRDGLVTLEDRRAKHVLDILKAEHGKTLKVGVLNNGRGTGVIEEIKSGRVVIRCVLDKMRAPERPRIDILLALPRPQVMKRLWMILPSIGVGQIILTNASKVERFYFDTHWLDQKFYMPLIVEGLEQSGDTMVPQVHISRQFKVMLEDKLDLLFPSGKRVLAHPDAGMKMSQLPVGDRERVLVAIGPEGGWTEHELALLQEHDFICANIGWRTLKTETACVAVMAVINGILHGQADSL